MGEFVIAAYRPRPGKEAMLLDPQFQKTLANAIVSGIKAFVSKP